LGWPRERFKEGVISTPPRVEAIGRGYISTTTTLHLCPSTTLVPDKKRGRRRKKRGEERIEEKNSSILSSPLFFFFLFFFYPLLPLMFERIAEGSGGCLVSKDSTKPCLHH